MSKKHKKVVASGGWGPAVRKLWKQGWKAEEVADELGLSRAVVYYHLSHKRNPDNKIVRTCARGNMNRVVEMTKNGLTAREIAAELGIAVSTVYVHRNHAREKGVLGKEDYGQRQVGQENRRLFGKDGVRASRRGLEHPGGVPKPLWLQRDRT
jgi:DNA-binding CsgD family transcriptional regulator